MFFLFNLIFWMVFRFFVFIFNFLIWLKCLLIVVLFNILLFLDYKIIWVLNWLFDGFINGCFMFVLFCFIWFGFKKGLFCWYFCIFNCIVWELKFVFFNERFVFLYVDWFNICKVMNFRRKKIKVNVVIFVIKKWLCCLCVIFLFIVLYFL